ncbi:MAG TPA: hypothetical protein VFN67_14695 [Polyangiales bacterium]|nr:hypothetical protein [Polyangiales bacterium]
MLVVQRPALALTTRRLTPVAWSCVSLLLHVLVYGHSCEARREVDSPSPLQLPTQVEFGLADGMPGGGDQTREPPPQPAAKPKAAVRRARVKAAPDPNAFAAAATQTERAAAKSAPDKPAAVSGEGEHADGGGAGLGSGMGPGSGFAPAGATIALNVDMQRIRKTALVLETEALLDIIPEWQALLAGSGIDPMRDLSRVFVASPTLERTSVVIAADHQLPRERVVNAVTRLASEQGKPAAFQSQSGFDVAAWRNRGSTERSIALTGAQQFTITRTSDLARVLQVADSLADIRKGQGVSDAELDRHGGLLAMEEREAVALWVEGAHKYLRSESPAVPESVRLSLFPVDQFNTELSVRAQYRSPQAAAEARAALAALQHELSEHPRVMFLGLKSAVDKAEIEPLGAALRLHVKLTLHQTRYLMGYVTRALKPRAKAQ